MQNPVKVRSYGRWWQNTEASHSGIKLQFLTGSTCVDLVCCRIIKCITPIEWSMCFILRVLHSVLFLLTPLYRKQVFIFLSLYLTNSKIGLSVIEKIFWIKLTCSCPLNPTSVKGVILLLQLDFICFLFWLGYKRALVIILYCQVTLCVLVIRDTNAIFDIALFNSTCISCSSLWVIIMGSEFVWSFFLLQNI